MTQSPQSPQSPQFGQPIPAETSPVFDQGFSTPDHSASHRSSEKAGTGTTPKAVRNVLGNLGNNRKTRGGPRKLREDDKQKIADWYEILGAVTRGFKPEIDQVINAPVIIGQTGPDGSMTPVAIGTRAQVCADAWYELAEQNDTVRRFILMFIETGAWGKLFTANLPILLVALPDDFMTRALTMLMPITNRHAQHAGPSTMEHAEQAEQTSSTQRVWDSMPT